MEALRLAYNSGVFHKIQRSTNPMKNSITLFLFTFVTPMWYSNKCEITSFDFIGQKWEFPSTVSDAVKTHHLNYKPPGYYYKIDSKGMEVLLDYHFEGGDFYNENQPKETLYPRNLHSYVFRFNEKSGLYDSLKNNLEQTYKSKFILTKGLKDSEYATEKEFEYNFLTVSPCLTIGIKRSSSEKSEKIITVRFMYDLPLGKMGIHMGNY